MTIAPPAPTKISIQVLLIDRQAMLRAGLRALLESHPGLHVIGEVATCAEAAATLQDRPDVIVLSFGGEGVCEGISNLLAASPESRILLLANAEDHTTHQQAIRLGARGLVAKDKPAGVLLKAIEKVHEGEAWFDRSVLTRMLAEISHPPETKRVDPEGARIASLTKRELEIITLVAQGLKNKAIADRLFISHMTVRHHLTSIFVKLGVADRLELMIYAFRHGLAEPPLIVTEAAVQRE